MSFPIPNGIGVDGNEIQFPRQRRTVLSPPQIIVRDSHGLGNLALHLSDVADDGFNRHHVVIPIHQRLVAYGDGDDATRMSY